MVHSGNWGVDLQAGSQYGYTLLFTVLLAGIVATFVQVGKIVLHDRSLSLIHLTGTCESPWSCNRSR